VPVVSCPKCPTKLKIPDGVSGNTKCPKCGAVFPVQAKPAFEVVEDAPARRPAAAPRPVPKPQPLEPDFEVLDDEEKPKRRREDDDEDDRPRKKRRRDDDDDEVDYDDEDDRPRSKKKAKKKRKKRYFDDEDDDNWQPRGAGGGGSFAKGRAGANLLSVAFWLNLGAYGAFALYAFIAWIAANTASSSSSSSGRSSRGSSGDGDGSVLDVLVILPGLVGLAAWIVGLIGCSFTIAGPAKARGWAITATVFAALHLVFCGITFANMQEGLGVGRGVPGLGKAAWIFVVSMLPALDAFLPMLFYQSKSVGSDYILALLGAICEVGRLIFALLTLKAIGVAARDHDAADRSNFGVTTASFVLGGVMVFTLLLAIMLIEGGFKSPSTYMNLGLGGAFLVYLAYTFMMLTPAIAAMTTRDACDRRS
jgi:hypothetical protein